MALFNTGAGNESSVPFWLVVAAVGFLGLALIGIPHRYAFQYGDVCRSLGEAFLIASVIAGTVDRYMKWRLLHETSHDISKLLIGYQLPPEAQNKIKEMMETRIIRKDYTVRYHLESIGDNRVRVSLISSWKLVNLTAVKQKYRQGVFFEKHEKPTILLLECASTDSKAVYKIAGDAIQVKDENRIIRVFGKEISIKPNKEIGGDTYLVSATVVFDAPSEYSDVIAFGGPTTDLTVEATIPGNFEFDVGGAEMSTAGQWLVKRFFMAGEHVRVRWWPKARSSEPDEVFGQD